MKIKRFNPLAALVKLESDATPLKARMTVGTTRNITNNRTTETKKNIGFVLIR